MLVSRIYTKSPAWDIPKLDSLHKVLSDSIIMAQNPNDINRPIF